MKPEAVRKFIRQNKRLLIILLIGGFLIFFRIGQVDMVHDDAHYTVRAVGLFDYMFSGDKQPSPVNLFENYPWWANLSFHDQPILLFLIQHFFFLFFGSTLFVAKLPYALMGLGSIILTYLWAKKLFGEKTGRLSALLLALNGYFIWVSRLTYLEGGVIFFSILALVWLENYIENNKYWWAFGAGLGLAFLTKYLAFFLAPTAIVYLLIRKPALFKSSKLYAAFGITLLCSLPIIIYNVMFYAASGHFDYQFSRLFQQSSPWQLSYVSGLTLANYVYYLKISLKIIGQSISWPYFTLLCLGVIYYAFQGFRSKTKKVLPLVAFVFSLLLITFLGPLDRYLPVAAAFGAIPTAWGIIKLKEWLKNKKAYWLKLYRGAVVAWLVYLGLFSINSQSLAKPLDGQTGLVMARNKFANYGIYQLDQYINHLLKGKNIMNRINALPELKIKKNSLGKYIVTSAEKNPAKDDFYAIFVYDRDINWFSRLWLFDRRIFYEGTIFVSGEEFAKINARTENIREFYFIKATSNTRLDQEKYQTHFADAIENDFIAKNLGPLDEIRRTDGQVAFKIYYYKTTSSRE